MTESAGLELEGHRLSLTNLDRVLWPATDFTKGQMIDYYLRVAPALLPHLEGRPLTLGRFPAGVDRRGFAQTECRGHPPWMATRTVRLASGEKRRFCLVDGPASLAWVSNQSAVELHTFLARGPRLERPAAVAYDLDPGPGRGLLDCCRVALALREALAAYGLLAVVKASGSRGLHVLVPISETHGYDQTKAFARRVARQLAELKPDEVVADVRGSSRAGRVFVDWLRNDERQTLVAPYSLRSSDQPRVSAPVSWDEVEATIRKGDPDRLLLGPEQLIRRLERDGDLWRSVANSAQRLPG